MVLISAYAISKLPKDFIKLKTPSFVSNVTQVNKVIAPGLKVGSNGEDVKILQILLGMDEAVYPERIVSGYFGDLTKKAVVRFQGKYDLEETGTVNKNTADKLNSLYGNETREYYLSLVPTPEVVEIQINQPIDDGEEWGKARQIGEHTWTMKVGMDERMATPQEVFEALNNYRRLHNRNTLYWDDRLAAYAQTRAQYFTQIKDLDSHAGFAEYVKSEENVRSLGFWALGENSSYGYRLNGTHLIEWVYAGDKPHDDNQLSSDWTHVGIGVDDNSSNLIFGGSQI